MNLMISETLKKHKQLLNQFITFRTAMVLTNLIVWSYYYILLFQETGSIFTLMLEYMIFMLGLYVGFVICTFFLDRVGYLFSFRFSSLLQALSMFLILAYINDLAVLFPLFAIIRGIGHGWYWPIEHSFNLKEMQSKERGQVISLMEGINLLLQIAIPALAGALISFSGGYQMTFLVGGIIYLVTIFIPFNYNQRAVSKISAYEISSILQNKHFIPFAFISFVMTGVMSLYGVLWLIIPYILLKEEFGVGILASIVGLVAAITAWMDSKYSLKTRIQLGYIGFFIYSFSTFLMAVVWTVPFLVLRSMALAFTNSVGTPARSDLDYRIREKILKDFKNESTLEMNLIVESIYAFSRIVFLTIFILIFGSIQDMSIAEEQIRLLVMIFAPIMFFVYGGFVWLYKKVKVQ
ncbi:MFS transporter [Candidatus Dojkabacteria bacterium]|uniref:MFS transporter n=1 Tax=Candidatus Dojkabacteria bacterium TaxID=2099670 RepID=A0A955LAW6_9BACT|nr:MFS transporter [Candidatus Dojkabacteria bacterium]